MTAREVCVLVALVASLALNVFLFVKAYYIKSAKKKKNNPFRDDEGVRSAHAVTQQK